MKKITMAEAKMVAEELKVDTKRIPLSDFMKGMNIEREHSNVTHGSLKTTGKIALAHLKESPQYYEALIKMEKKLSKGKNEKTGKKASKKRD